MKKIFFGLATLLLLTGCIPSFYSLYTEKDLILEPRLNGTWQEPKGNEYWTFLQDTVTRKYKVSYTSDSSTADFTGGLVKLGGELFLDTYPEKIENENPMLSIQRVPMHLFFRVRIANNKLQLVVMNPDRLEKMLKQKQSRLKYEQSDDMTILVSPTKDLQQFITKYSRDTALFDDQEEPLIRK